MMMVMV